MDFTFKITNNFLKRFPNYKVGGILFTNLKAKKVTDYSVEIIADNLVKNVLLKRANYFEKSPSVVGWKKLFTSLGLNSEKYVASHIALTRRVIKNKQLMRINPIVDLYNIVSLYRSIPLGGHTIDEIATIAVDITQGGEVFKPMGSAEHEKSEPNEAAYMDESRKEILTRHLVWRQDEHSKVTLESKNIFVPIDDGLGKLSDSVIEEIASELIGLFEMFFDFDYSFGIASRFNPVLDFSKIVYKPEGNKPTLLLATAPVITDTNKVNSFFDRKLADIFPSKDAFTEALKSGRRLKFYMGADCTAPRLHVGHMIPFMKMAELQKLGHQIIFLIGDFTGRIGDPTDKSATRVQLTPEEIAVNAEEFRKQVAKVIDFDSKENPAIMVFNSKWNEELKFQDILELCTNFTVQQMLERDMFEKRMKENKPIHLHEFMYPLMQGYDSVYMEVDGEFGGKDQTFNMLAGRQLMESVKAMDKFVITVPTLLSSDGVTKMSKSIGNCIFLTDSPRDKFGKIMAIPDNLIIHYYQLITRLSDTEILAIQTRISEGTLAAMDAKKQLGYELVKMLDGEEEAKKALTFFEKTIQEGEAPEDAPSSTKSDLTQKLGPKPAVKELLTTLNLTPSNAEAKRLIQSGAVEIDGKKVIEITATADISKISLIKVGKRNWHRLVD